MVGKKKMARGAQPSDADDEGMCWRFMETSMDLFVLPVHLCHLEEPLLIHRLEPQLMLSESLGLNSLTRMFQINMSQTLSQERDVVIALPVNPWASAKFCEPSAVVDGSTATLLWYRVEQDISFCHAAGERETEGLLKISHRYIADFLDIKTPHIGKYLMFLLADVCPELIQISRIIFYGVDDLVLEGLVFRMEKVFHPKGVSDVTGADIHYWLVPDRVLVPTESFLERAGSHTLWCNKQSVSIRMHVTPLFTSVRPM